MSETAGAWMRLQTGGDQRPAQNQAQSGRGEGHDARKEERFPPLRHRGMGSDRHHDERRRGSSRSRRESSLSSSFPRVKAGVCDAGTSRSSLQMLLEGRRNQTAGAVTEAGQRAGPRVAERPPPRSLATLESNSLQGNSDTNC